jgi:hypothetical protein
MACSSTEEKYGYEDCNLVPRLFHLVEERMAGAGHVSHGNLIAQGGVGKVSNYMLPLSHFTLLLQGVSVLYRSTLRLYIFAKFDLCLLLNYNNILNRFL